MRIPASVHVRL